MDAVAQAFADEAILFFAGFPHLQQKFLTSVAYTNYRLGKHVYYCEWGREKAVFKALDKTLDELLVRRIHGFKCKRCKGKFANKHLLRRHIRRVHSGKISHFSGRGPRRHPATPAQETTILADHFTSKLTIDEPMDLSDHFTSKLTIAENQMEE